MTAKEKKAREYRNFGFTYRKIGLQMGISTERARQLCNNAEIKICDIRKYHPDSLDLYVYLNSDTVLKIASCQGSITRLFNVLARNDIKTLDELKKVDCNKLLEKYNVGLGTIKLLKAIQELI